MPALYKHSKKEKTAGIFKKAVGPKLRINIGIAGFFIRTKSKIKDILEDKN